uniref:RING-type domain-containing protein n=1 Tax=Panagrolaimus sp. PS1159 TaxID=55785 RepID=A0AC35GB47_9BILA
MTEKESAIKTEGNVNLKLNRYDRQRVPHSIINHQNIFENSSGIVLEKFRNELSCKVCKKLLNDPVLSRTCMHRFCSGCVVNGANITLTRCPECNVQFLGNPAFLRDHTFLQIIKKLKPKQCDTGRRNLYAALQATGVDVNGYLSKPTLDEHISRNQWSYSDDLIPGPSMINDSDNPPFLNSNYSLHSNGTNSLNSPIKPQDNDVIHLLSQNGAIQIFYHQLIKLPFILEPNSLLQLSETSRYSNSLQAYSLCGTIRPNFVAKLQEIRLSFNNTKECQQLLALMPAFILKLFPKGFVSKFMREREHIPDLPLITQKQRFNNGMLLNIILFPDSSVMKMKDLPRCMRRPRYIYSPPNATIGHLQEFLKIRSEIESRFRSFRQKYDVEFAAILGERQEIVLRLNTNPEESPNNNNGGGGESQEIVLRVRCPPSTYSDKRLSNFDNMIILRYPFEPLPKNLKIKDLIKKSSILNRPLKVVFRYCTLNNK